MFRYPNTRLEKIVAAEAYCILCERWFGLSEKELKYLNKNWQAHCKREVVPLRICVCKHCGKEQRIVTPGKYDWPKSPKNRCKVQFLTFEKD